MSAKKISGIVISFISLICFLSLSMIFGKAFGLKMIGVFGVFGYPFFIFMALVGIALIKEAKYQFSWKFILYLSILTFCVCSIIHLSFTFGVLDLSYSAYIKEVFASVTPGGVIFAILTWPIQYLLFPVGAYVILILSMAIMIALIIDYLHATQNFRRLALLSSPKNYNNPKKTVNYKTDSLGLTMGGFYDAKFKEGVSHQPLPAESNIDENKPIFKVKMGDSRTEEKVLSAREEALIKLGFGNREASKTVPIKENPIPQAEPVKIDRNDPKSIILNPKTVGTVPDFETAKRTALEMMAFRNQAVEENVSANFVGNVTEPQSQSEKPQIDHNNINSFFSSNFSITNNEPAKSEADVEFIHEEKVKEVEQPESFIANTTSTDESIDKIIKEIQEENPDLIAEDDEIDTINPGFKALVEEEIQANNVKLEEFVEPKVNSESELVRNFKQNFAVKKDKPDQQSFFQEERTETKSSRPTFTLPSNYVRPHIEILKTYVQEEDYDDDELKEKANILEDTLNNFKVPVNVVAITKGPAVTRFELQVQQGITVKKILQFSNDIAMALEAKGGIRIEAPIPGKNAVGIEVPNNKIQTIGLKDILSTEEFRKSAPLAVGLGRDIGGSTILCDIKQMPHLMVAGATGSGKSVCLSVLLISLLYKLGPDELKLILIDPKRVEFSAFNGLPHMLLPEAITEPKDAISALTWAMNEMDRRFSLFHELRVNKIDDYNNRDDVRSGKEPKLPTIVIVIDELADLIMTAKRDVEEKIRRLSQLARAAGIHLVVATQRPSVDVITGTIKANLPSRIAFMVSSGPDSKTILDQYGAENLLGKGDMLYSPSNYTEPRRVQCAFVSGDEVRAVVEDIKKNNVALFDETVQKEIFKKDEEPVISNGDMDDSKSDFDSILPDALKLAIETRQASVSMIQRRFAVGYSRAARILDQMERMKFVSPSDGSKARSVYITMEEYNAIFGDK